MEWIDTSRDAISRELLNRKWDASRVVGNISVNPGVHVYMHHNSIGEYYDAHIWYNCIDDCVIISMSFHGIDNQGRKYYNPSFAIRKYKHLRLAFQTIETMVENRNRLNLWIRRNSVDIVSQSV